MNPFGILADAPAHTIREQTEGTKHMLMGGTDEANGYMIKKIDCRTKSDTTNCQFLMDIVLLMEQHVLDHVDADYNARLNTNKQVISRVDRYNIGNSSSLASHAQNVTTFSNTATKPAELYGNNFCKQTPSTTTCWTSCW